MELVFKIIIVLTALLSYHCFSDSIQAFSINGILFPNLKIQLLAWPRVWQLLDWDVGYLIGKKVLISRPRWSRGNLLASRSKVRGFKFGLGRWVFFQDVEILSTSPPGGSLSWGSRV